MRRSYSRVTGDLLCVSSRDLGAIGGMTRPPLEVLPQDPVLVAALAQRDAACCGQPALPTGPRPDTMERSWPATTKRCSSVRPLAGRYFRAIREQDVHARTVAGRHRPRARPIRRVLNRPSWTPDQRPSLDPTRAVTRAGAPRNWCIEPFRVGGPQCARGCGPGSPRQGSGRSPPWLFSGRPGRSGSNDERDSSPGGDRLRPGPAVADLAHGTHAPCAPA